MTPNEAIEILSDGSVCRHLPEEYDWAVDMAKEALEKQILNKPKEIEGRVFCPVCGVYLVSKDVYDRVLELEFSGLKQNFCYRCGQALDWGEKIEI